MVCDGYTRIVFVISDPLRHVQFTRLRTSFKRSHSGVRPSYQEGAFFNRDARAR